MALSMGVRDKHETARRNVAHFTIAGLVLHRAINPDCQHRLRHSMPSDFSHSGRDMRDAYPRGWVAGRDIEGYGVRVNRPCGRWQIDLIEMRLAIR